MPTNKDTRYCYGAVCTWHGPIKHTINSSGIPGCPHCGGPLFQMESKEEWDSKAKEFGEDQDLPFYFDWINQLNKYGCIPLKGWNWKESYEKFVKEKQGDAR